MSTALWREMEKNLSLEKTLREQEDELRKLRYIESANTRLTSEVETLRHEVTELTRRNTSTSKRLEQQKEQLKNKDAEQEKLREQLKKQKTESQYFKLEVEKLVLEKHCVAKIKQKSAELVKEVETQKNLNKIHQDNISCFQRKIVNLESDRRDLKLSQREMSSQMDKMRKDMDALKSEIQTRKDEALKQSSLIAKLRSDMLIGETGKGKLEKNADDTMQRIKDQDQIISDLKTEIKNNKDEQTEMKIQIAVLKNERDLNLEKLSKAKLLKIENDHTIENLSKAQRVICLLNTTIEKQQQEIQDRTLDQNKVGTELDQVKKDYDSACNQLTEISKTLEKRQVLHNRYNDNVQQDIKLGQKRYKVILTDKEGLERELQHSVQKAAKDALEQTVKTLRLEVESLTLQNRELRTENNRLTVTSKKCLSQKPVFVPDREKQFDSIHLLCKDRQHFQQEQCVQRQAALMDTQRKERPSRHRRFPLSADRTPSQAEDRSSRVPVSGTLTTTALQTLREQEDELRKLRYIESANTRLTSEVETLRHEVTELTRRNTSTSKRLEQQKEQLKNKDAEQEKLREQLKKQKTESQYFKLEVEKLVLEKHCVAKIKQKSAELVKEVETQKNLNKIHQDNISCFQRKIVNLESDRRDLKLSQREMSSQMDKMRKDMDALKSEIQTRKDEALKQSSLIAKLRSDMLIGETGKGKLEKNADDTMQRIKDQDQIISDLKTEIKNNKDEQTEMKIQIAVLKNERDLNLEKLSKAKLLKIENDHTIENLSKAQRVICLLNTTIEKQQQEIQDRTLDQNKVGTELDQVKKDYDSACNQLTEISKTLEKRQVLHNRYNDNVQQDIKLGQKRYKVILTDKEGLERELQHSVQKAAKDALEQTVKTLRLEVESLTLQNRELRTENNRLTVTSKKCLSQKPVFVPDREKQFDSIHLLCKDRQHFQQEQCVQRQAALMDTQRKERPSRHRRFPLSADRTPSQAEDRSSRVPVSGTLTTTALQLFHDLCSVAAEDNVMAAGLAGLIRFHEPQLFHD
ncbi:hypothetical protein ABVT39_004995 [Epinephelus coioides]